MWKLGCEAVVVGKLSHRGWEEEHHSVVTRHVPTNLQQITSEQSGVAYGPQKTRVVPISAAPRVGRKGGRSLRAFRS